MNSINKQLAFIFPGQGSQKIGMLAEMNNQYPAISEYFRLASEVLDYDLWALVQEGEQEAINMTEVTQPLLLTASIALPFGIAGSEVVIVLPPLWRWLDIVWGNGVP